MSEERKGQKEDEKERKAGLKQIIMRDLRKPYEVKNTKDNQYCPAREILHGLSFYSSFTLDQITYFLPLVRGGDSRHP